MYCSVVLVVFFLFSLLSKLTIQHEHNWITTYNCFLLILCSARHVVCSNKHIFLYCESQFCEGRIYNIFYKHNFFLLVFCASFIAYNLTNDIHFKINWSYADYIHLHVCWHIQDDARQLHVFIMVPVWSSINGHSFSDWFLWQIERVRKCREK